MNQRLLRWTAFDLFIDDIAIDSTYVPCDE